MPSQLHEGYLAVLRKRPAFVPKLLGTTFGTEFPAHREVQLHCADLTDVQPTEYRADMVVVLTNGSPVYGIIVEVQLSANERKSFVWPAYVANLRAQLGCPVCLLVITPDESVARWAANAVDMGGGNVFVPTVLGPSAVPEITDEAQALANPELAVLSAMAHGDDRDSEKAIKIACAAQMASRTLDEERSQLYSDLIMLSLSEAARKALRTMEKAKSKLQDEIDRAYFAWGKADGIAEGIAQGTAQGRGEMIIRMLTLRFGPLSNEAQTRILTASIAEQDAIGERLLTASSVEEALGS